MPLRDLALILIGLQSRPFGTSVPMPTVHDTRLNEQHADRVVPAGIPAGPWTRPYVHWETHDIGGKPGRGLG